MKKIGTLLFLLFVIIGANAQEDNDCQDNDFYDNTITGTQEIENNGRNLLTYISLCRKSKQHKNKIVRKSRRRPIKVNVQLLLPYIKLVEKIEDESEINNLEYEGLDAEYKKLKAKDKKLEKKITNLNKKVEETRRCMKIWKAPKLDLKSIQACINSISAMSEHEIDLIKLEDKINIAERKREEVNAKIIKIRALLLKNLKERKLLDLNSNKPEERIKNIRFFMYNYGYIHLEKEVEALKERIIIKDLKNIPFKIELNFADLGTTSERTVLRIYDQLEKLIPLEKVKGIRIPNTRISSITKKLIRQKSPRVKFITN